jgi:uncharacterized protein (TIGR02646 family)
MIKIERTQCPTSLQKDPEQIRENDCNNDDVKTALMEMQYGKCCYCERKIRDLSATEREVEHYVPKSSLKDMHGKIQWHLANSWENLLYSCRSCNSRKSTKYPYNQETNEMEIINPSNPQIDPEDHIDFEIDFPIIAYKAKDGSALGAATIEKLRFRERVDLFRKFRKITVVIEDYFADLINNIEAEDRIEIDSKRNELFRFMSANLSFASFRRKFVRLRLNKLNDDDVPKLESRHGKSYERINVNFPTGSEVVT